MGRAITRRVPPAGSLFDINRELAQYRSADYESGTLVAYNVRAHHEITLRMKRRKLSFDVLPGSRISWDLDDFPKFVRLVASKDLSNQTFNQFEFDGTPIDSADITLEDSNVVVVDLTNQLPVAAGEHYLTVASFLRSQDADTFIGTVWQGTATETMSSREGEQTFYAERGGTPKMERLTVRKQDTADIILNEFIRKRQNINILDYSIVETGPSKTIWGWIYILYEDAAFLGIEYIDPPRDAVVDDTSPEVRIKFTQPLSDPLTTNFHTRVTFTSATSQTFVAGTASSFKGSNDLVSITVPAGVVNEGIHFIRVDTSNLQGIDGQRFIGDEAIYSSYYAKLTEIVKEDDALFDFLNGSTQESPDIELTDVNPNVALLLNNDLTVKTSSGWVTLSSPAAVNLTLGTATVPQINYVYIDTASSTPSLTKSTTGWPVTSHAPIAIIMIQDRATWLVNGAIKLHAYTDHLSSNADGHASHIGKKIRIQPADWVSGVAITTDPVVSASAGYLYADTTAGIVTQLHPHGMPAQDVTVEGAIVINHPTTPFVNVTDLATVTVDSENVSLTNKYYSLIFWGIASEEAVDSHLVVSLPSGSYATEQDASDDSLAYGNYTIPKDYAGVGFLIARVNIRNVNDTTWTVNSVNDLRGIQAIPGVGGGAGVTSHLDLTDIGTDSHATIDSHIDDTTLHFTEATIDHNNISNNGSTSHADIDTHVGLTDEHINWTVATGTIHTDNYIEGGPGTDTTAIHDINSLSVAGIASGDFVPFWDLTATAANKKITFANLEGTLSHNALADYVANEHATQLLNITTATDTYNVTSANRILLCNKGTTFTVNLPTVDNFPTGVILYIKNIDGTATVDINPDDTESLEFGAVGVAKSIAANAGDVMAIVNDNTQWWIVSTIVGGT